MILHKEHQLLGRYLWERINDTGNNDLDALTALGTITFDLMDAFGGKYTGFMHELNIWIGLKRDAPMEFTDYGKSIKTDFPEFFR